MIWVIISSPAEQSFEILIEFSPLIGSNHKGHLSSAVLSAPAKRLWVDQPALSQELTLTWNSQGYVMPSQANLRLGNPKRLSPVLSHVRHDLLPPLPQTHGIDKFSPKLLSPVCIWDMQCRSSLCSEYHKLQREIHPWLSSPGSWHN